MIAFVDSMIGVRQHSTDRLFVVSRVWPSKNFRPWQAAGNATHSFRGDCRSIIHSQLTGAGNGHSDAIPEPSNGILYVVLALMRVRLTLIDTDDDAWFENIWVAEENS